MKGTYDNPNIEFGIKATYFDRGEEKELDITYPFEKCEGLTVQTISFLFLAELAQKGINIKDTHISGLNLYANIKGLTYSDAIKTDYFLTKICGYGNQSIDFAFANSLKDYVINGVDFQTRKFALAFLERYVLDYEDVRKFVETGKHDLDKIDSVIGVSSQGTSVKR